MFLSTLFKKDDRPQKTSKSKSSKLNVANIFGKEEQVCRSMVNINLNYNCSSKRHQQFNRILTDKIANITQLKQLAWNGIPEKFRSIGWKLLLQYIPTNKDNQQDILIKKRNDYFNMVKSYIQKPTIQLDIHQQKIYKLIHDDVVRTHPSTELFRNLRIQKLLHRVLFVWHMRHPKCGYVQGLNDIATPFIMVFLSEYIPINFDTLKLPDGFDKIQDQILENVEGDVYWCFGKFLDGILDNYAKNWPGINKSYEKVVEVIERVDGDLLKHLKGETVDFYQIYFKWVTCLLLRQFSVNTGLRLFDSFFTDCSNYFNLCEFISAAIILKYSKKLKKMKFEGIMSFQHNMPTKSWSEQDISTIIAEAYVYQNYFDYN